MESILDLVLELYRAARETPVDEFPDLALSMLSVAVPFRSASWTQAEFGSSGFQMHGVHLHNEPPEIVGEFAKLNRRYPATVTAAARRPGTAVAVYSADLYNLPEQQDMRDYLKRYAHERNMIVVAGDLKRSFGEWLSLYRPECGEAFSEQDQTVIEKLMPHLVEAININRAIATCVGGASEWPSRCGRRAIISQGGVILHCGMRFLELMRQELADWDEPRLPRSILDALQRDGSLLIANGRARLSAQRIGRALMITADAVSPLATLSPRERAVAVHSARGKSYKEIARAENVAPATVRNMLQSAYRKLGVHNKVSLARLMDAVNCE